MKIFSFKSIGSAFILCFLGFYSVAQSKIISNSTKLAISAQKATQLNLFEISEERDPLIDAGINNVIYLKLNKDALQKISGQRPSTIAFDLPLGDHSAKVLMHQYDIFDVDFKARTKGSSGVYRSVAKPDGVHYRGFSDGDDHSLAALSFFENEIGGIISFSDIKDNYNLVLNKQNPGANKDRYLLYKGSDVINGADYAPVCQVGAVQENATSPAVQRRTAATELGLSCKTVSIALYGDHKLYQKNAGSLSATQNYLTILFNGVAALYENDGIRVALKQLNVNTSDDLYPTATSTEVLFKFGNEINTNVTADLMQFVTGHTVTTGGGFQHPPLGGLAWLNVLCSSPFYYQDHDTYVGPYSMINTVGSAAIPLVPVYSWDISCSAHEFGHNLGSPHTHNCAWNGDNTAIDDCAGTFNSIYADNNCGPASIPSNGGTIMSYCHLLSGVGINFTNGFGPQPAGLIRTVVNDATCLNNDHLPKLVLNAANANINANGFCINNNELYCYDTKNDLNRSNDELLLIIENSNIGSLSIADLQISMSTTPQYASNVAIDATGYSYVDVTEYATWFTANRNWYINWDQNMTGNIKLTFPFLQQDKEDLSGSNPAMNNNNDSIYFVIYKTEMAAQDPQNATSADVAVYPLGNGAGNWTFNTDPHHHSASINTDQAIFGATMATAQKQTDLGLRTFANADIIKLFPNPAQSTLSWNINKKAVHIKSVEITDYLGRTVFTHATENSAQQQINIGSLAAGPYLFKCVTDKGIYMNKFVKQ